MTSHSPLQIVPPVFQRPADFDPARFRDPPAIDRGAPLWSWNGPLDSERLARQWEVYRAMGLGGGTVHPRTGLTAPYLGPEFIGHIADILARAREDGQLVWLYDEDRWPSGFAGGLAVRDQANWMRHLRLTRRRFAPDEIRLSPMIHGQPRPPSSRQFFAAWALESADGLLTGHRRVAEEDPAADLYAYLEVPAAHTWFNHAQYLDTLNPAAVRTFLDVTHELYLREFGGEFGGRIPAIFTDEPQYRGMDLPLSLEDSTDRYLAWSGALPGRYRARFGEDLVDLIPDLCYERADGGHYRARWRFHEVHTGCFVEAFAAQIGGWCAEHGIALTGHMMMEESLLSQTRAVGDVMRSLRHFQLPGIDMLCDAMEFTTAKQAQSISRQTRAPGVLSELYGVTNWDFPFAGHKRQGDWQAALGVTTRVHHLTWLQMGGEAKRDYPASFGEHVPWWPVYREVEDHFGRLTAALRSGRPHCRVGLLHPVESMWLVHGPSSAALRREALERGFAETLTWLLESLIDVDLINEACLPELMPELPDGPRFAVGDMTYEVVVVPPMLTLRRSTLERLEAFAAAGGEVLLLGTPPEWVEGEPLQDAEVRTANWRRLPFTKADLVDALAPWRSLELRQSENGAPARDVLHQMRDLPDGGRLLFVSRHAAGKPRVNLRLRGEWNPESLDTASGEKSPLGARLREGWTEIPLELHAADHVLLHLHPGAPATAPALFPDWRELSRLPAPSRVECAEDNVWLLDRAAWRLDDGEWQAEVDVLRLDNLARAALGQPPRHGNIPQPWAEPPAKDTHRLCLRYRLVVEQEAAGPLRLALEDAARARIFLDGAEVPPEPAGEWIDVAFQTRRLPPLTAGEHRLEIEWPFGGAAGIEAAYLLGNFGMRVLGVDCRMTAPATRRSWGDVSRHDLPFYGGNIRYLVEMVLPREGRLALQIPQAAAACVGVCIGGEELGLIHRAPWRLEISTDLRGPQTVELTAYGNRFNTFGQLHNCDPDYSWWGPPSWRTLENQWADEYQLRPSGILIAPMLMGV